MTRLVRSFAVAAALLGLLTIVACGGEEEEGTPTTQATATPTSVGEEGERTPAAEATAAPTTPAGGPIEMGIDPETTGNTASTIGPGGVEACVRFDKAGGGFDGISDYTIDVVVTGDTLAPVIYDSSLNYSNPSLVHVVATGTDIGIKMPSGFCLSDAFPDSDGTFTSGCTYLAGGPGTAGDGTIVRVGLDVDGTSSGVVTFSFNPDPSTDYWSGAIDSPDHHPVVLGSGMLAINQDCPR